MLTFECYAAPPVRPLSCQDLLTEVVPGIVVSYASGQEIYGEGERPEYAYRVLSGAVRSFRVLRDGRRQVEAFHLPRQVFSMEMGDTYDCSTEALCETRLLAMKISTIESMMQTNPGVARGILSWAAESLTQAREQVVLLGRKTATEKVASFVLELDKADPDAESLTLPMSRYDIADYLGLTIETVSRAFANLQKADAIDMLSARHVVMRDRDGLRRLAGQS
jgi:CRP/FNR family nitrogen fixation transcriptional regulator